MNQPSTIPSIWSTTTAQFLDQIASGLPTPGGGSASIVAANFGMALLHKTAAISENKFRHDIGRGRGLGNLREKIHSFMEELRRYADEDSRAYQDYMAARLLPERTEVEKLVRIEAMSKSLLDSSLVPIKAAEMMCQGMILAEQLVALSAKHLLSDAFTGVLLLHAAAKAVLLNVDANLPGIADPDQQVELQQRRHRIEDATTLHFKTISRDYVLRIGRTDVG